MARLLNNFLIGCDPEMILMNPPDVVKGDIVGIPASHNHFGYDHGGFVIEPHPMPDMSVRQVVKNLKTCLETIAHFKGDSYNWRAGAWIHTPRRMFSLGGHVHIDQPKATVIQKNAMDRFTKSLEGLDILPLNASRERRTFGSYGQFGDVRLERNRFEYRTMCSWLFSRKTSMLAMTGIKLAFLAPETIEKIMDSKQLLEKWFTLFKGKDDDVDWILNKNYFATNLEAQPDRDIKSVWRIEPKLNEEFKLPSVVPVSRVTVSPQQGGMVQGIVQGTGVFANTATGYALANYYDANLVQPDRIQTGLGRLFGTNNPYTE